MESPIILGMTLIFLFVIILCGATLAVLYWKSLAQVAKTQQIACPLNKFCPAGTKNDGSLASVKIILPVDFDEITDGEEITFPYYDSNSNPVQKNLVVAFNTTDDVPGSNASTYLDISNVGYSTYTSSSPNITIYVAGLSGRDDVSSILPAIFLKAFRQSGSPVRKLAFVDITTGTTNGNDYLQYAIKTFGISENVNDLNVSSSNSSSTILTGVDSLTFTATMGVNPEQLTDVYADMNYINKYQIAPAFLGTTQSRCVEPSFNAKSCENTSYVGGVWKSNFSNPNVTSATILDDWADYPDDQTDAPPTFCAFNLDQVGSNNSGSTAGVNGGSGQAGIGGYQQNKFGTTITGSPDDKSGGTLFNSGTAPPGSTGGAPYTNPQEAGNDPLNSTTQQSPYIQTSVFCGGAERGAKNYNLGTNPNPTTVGDPTVAYSSSLPNPDNYPNYTTLGFQST